MKLNKNLISASLILLVVISLSLSLTASISAAPESQSDTPVHGWRVCEDLGMGSIPGVGDPRQRFRLCNSGWEVLTFCVNPGVTPPTVGSLCSRVSENRYWCGDGVQEIQFYQLQQTPAPEPSAIPTFTPTFTPVPTLTPLPTSLPPTQETEDRPIGGGEENHTPTSVPPLDRPQPGGPGNLGYLLAAGVSFLGGSGFTLYRFLNKRK